VSVSATTGTVTLESALVDPFYQLVDTRPFLDAGESEVLTIEFFTTSTATITNTATATSFEGTVSSSATVILCDTLLYTPAGSCSSFPDLSVEWTTTATLSKGKLKGKALLRNNGSVDALNIPYEFVLSSDGCPGAGDLSLSSKILKKLKAGKTKKLNLSAKLLNPAVSGQNVVLGVDTANTVQECDETNNVAASGPLP
jgi:hypothetical protein